MGEVVSFVVDPATVKDALPQPGHKRAAGVVMGCLEKPPSQPGNIKDLTLSVRGRSGKHATISVVDNYAMKHANYGEADFCCIMSSKEPWKELVSELTPDPMGEYLHTRFVRFVSNEYKLHGLLYCDGSRLHVLAIESEEKHQGNFGRWIVRAKELVPQILFWAVLNPELRAILGKYDFEPASDHPPNTREKTGCWRWTRK